MMIYRIPFIFLFVFTILSYGAKAQNENFIMTPIGANNFLHKPWDLNYGPDGYLWVTERERGIVVRVDPTSAERDELIQIPDHSSTASQDGLLGLAFHSGFALDTPYVYLSYTYFDGQRRQKIVRYTYEENESDGALSDPFILLDSLPASNDHNSGRLVFGPDAKLYYTIGDQGGNQNANYCNEVLSQFLPTQEEIDQRDWSNYPGKVLRINTDGTIPEDNLELNGVRSHIYSYGHRNPQGLVFGVNGLLYSDEHGPDTDDEVNIIYSGKNYGWPNVVGFLDNQAYDYCNWSSADNCLNLNYSKTSCPANATFQEESAFTDSNYQEPLASMFAVTDGYDFNDPKCSSSWICRPNVAPSSIAIYEGEGIPGWNKSLLVTSLKRGQIFRYQLDENGTAIIGDTTRHFYSPNRYRDIVVHPDGKTFFILTGQTGRTSTANGLSQASTITHPGNILKFTLDETVSSNKEGTLEPPFSIYPNPAGHLLTISLRPSFLDKFEISLTNLAGQQLLVVPPANHQVLEIPVATYPRGIYVLKVSTAAYSWQQRVILQ